MKKLFVILFISVFIFSFGCGKKDEKSAGDTEKTESTESTEKSDEKVDTKIGDLGISSGLPDDYPSDIPQPKSGKCLGYLTSSEGTVVTFETEEPFSDIVTQYKEELKNNGYKEESSGVLSTEGKMYMAAYKKDSKEVSVIINFVEEDKKTNTVITYKK
ncbi:MAG: hypothetical protein JW917_04490 [Ignavibacteria bacterium]|nr:hypothetical protein [Ignavibacteria bacterium]